MTVSDSRWICKDLGSAMDWVKTRNRQGIRCVLDPLGELAKGDGSSEASYSNYMDLVDSINKHGLFSSISIKPSALGAAYDKDGCESRISIIAKRSWGAGVAVELDMESRKYLEFTIGMARNLVRSEPGSISIALQAYMYRTPKDLRDLSWEGIRVRLVKGTYSGDIEDYGDIQTAALENIDMLHSMGKPFTIGTHDPIIIKSLVKDRSMKGLVEIGMLKGLGDETKLLLVKKGWSVAEYVPFGADSRSYIARRENYLRKMSEQGTEPCP